jgi:DNA-binding MarR family transcriptional regulator
MDEDDPGLQLFHQLRRVTVEMELSRAEFARRNGLHATDLRALIALLDAARAGRPATPGWLGDQLGLNSAGTTTLIDRLERLGHVHRVRDTRDRRKIFLEVTPQAVDLGWSFFGPLINDMVAGMRSLRPGELETVRRFLVTMAEIAAAPRRGERGAAETSAARAGAAWAGAGESGAAGATGAGPAGATGAGPAGTAAG